MPATDSINRVAAFKVAFITCASVFLMGYINAFTFNAPDLGLMATPQSGNIIWLGINAASGSWRSFADNLGLFFGFIAGTVFAVFTQNIFKNKKIQFFFNWTTFVLPVILYPLVMQYVAPPYVSYFVLGFACGAALGFFRKLYHLEINNAMATANVRLLGLNFAGAYLKKNKKEVAAFRLYLLCVFLYAAGAFFYTKFAQMDSGLGLDGRGHAIGLGGHYIDGAPSNIVRVAGLIVFCAIPYFFCPKSAAAE